MPARNIEQEHLERASTCQYCLRRRDWPQLLGELPRTLETLGVRELPELEGSPKQTEWALHIRAEKLNEVAVSWNEVVSGLSELAIVRLTERAFLNPYATHWISKRLEAYTQWVISEKSAIVRATVLEKGIHPEQPTVAPEALKLAWAEFMSLCRWAFVWDPPAVGYWQPDFIITGDQGNTIYVAVVPTNDFPEKIASQLEAVSKDVGVPGEILILGNGPFESERGCSIGWLTQFYVEGIEWAEATWGRWVRKEEFENDPLALFDPEKNENNRPGFSHSEGVFRDRITGLHNGGRSEGRGVPPPDAIALFQACRRYQW